MRAMTTATKRSMKAPQTQARAVHVTCTTLINVRYVRFVLVADPGVEPGLSGYESKAGPPRTAKSSTTEERHELESVAGIEPANSRFAGGALDHSGIRT